MGDYGCIFSKIDIFNIGLSVTLFCELLVHTYTKRISPIKINETKQLAKPEKYCTKSIRIIIFKRGLFSLSL